MTILAVRFLKKGERQHHPKGGERKQHPTREREKAAPTKERGGGSHHQKERGSSAQTTRKGQPTTDHPTRRDKKWATSGAHLHAKIALCARAWRAVEALRLVSLGCVRRTVVQGYITDVNHHRCAATFVHANEVLGDRGIAQSRKKCEKCGVNTTGNELVAACLTPISVFGESHRQTAIRQQISVKIARKMQMLIIL